MTFASVLASHSFSVGLRLASGLQHFAAGPFDHNRVEVGPFDVPHALAKPEQLLDHECVQLPLSALHILESMIFFAASSLICVLPSKLMLSPALLRHLLVGGGGLPGAGLECCRHGWHDKGRRLPGVASEGGPPRNEHEIPEPTGLRIHTTSTRGLG